MNREAWADGVARSALGELPAALPGSPLHEAIINAVLRHCDPRGVKDWQPIDSAPTDDRRIIIGRFNEQYQWETAIVSWHILQRSTFLPRIEWSHWAPLPEPPK